MGFWGGAARARVSRVDGQTIEGSTAVPGVGTVRWRGVEQLRSDGSVAPRLKIFWVEERDNIPTNTLTAMLMEHDSRL